MSDHDSSRCTCCYDLPHVTSLASRYASGEVITEGIARLVDRRTEQLTEHVAVLKQSLRAEADAALKAQLSEVDLRAEVERLKAELAAAAAKFTSFVKDSTEEELRTHGLASLSEKDRLAEALEDETAALDAALALADATQAELAAERERHHATAGRVERLTGDITRADVALVDLDASHERLRDLIYEVICWNNQLQKRPMAEMMEALVVAYRETTTHIPAALKETTP